MAKNYYLILGIPQDASREDIRTAFRRRAMELHPDRSGMESGPFQEVQEAYSVLADPERRRRYDQERPRPAVKSRPWSRKPESFVPRRPPAEPFRPVQPAWGFHEVSLRESFETYGPSFDELFERLWSNFEDISRPKSERLESLTVEAVVSAEEARWGGEVRLWIPARATCSACRGYGLIGGYDCWRCEGNGALTAEYPVEVRYPPGIPDGYAVRIPLSRFGIENFYLTVVFRVDYL